LRSIYEGFRDSSAAEKFLIKPKLPNYQHSFKNDCLLMSQPKQPTMLAP
jgi:hypothetical protein